MASPSEVVTSQCGLLSDTDEGGEEGVAHDATFARVVITHHPSLSLIIPRHRSLSLSIAPVFVTHHPSLLKCR